MSSTIVSTQPGSVAVVPGPAMGTTVLLQAPQNTFDAASYACGCVPIVNFNLEVGQPFTTLTTRPLFCTVHRDVAPTKDTTSYTVISSITGCMPCAHNGFATARWNKRLTSSLRIKQPQWSAVADAFRWGGSQAHGDLLDLTTREFKHQVTGCVSKFLTCRDETDALKFGPGAALVLTNREAHCICASCDETINATGTRLDHIAYDAHYVPKGALACCFSPFRPCSCSELASVGLTDGTQMTARTSKGQSQEVATELHRRLWEPVGLANPRVVKSYKGSTLLCGADSELQITTAAVVHKQRLMNDLCNTITGGLCQGEIVTTIPIGDVKMVTTDNTCGNVGLVLRSHMPAITRSAGFALFHLMSCSFVSGILDILAMVVAVMTMVADLILCFLPCRTRLVVEAKVPLEFDLRPAADAGTNAADLASQVAVIVRDTQAESAAIADHATAGADKSTVKVNAGSSVVMMGGPAPAFAAPPPPGGMQGQVVMSPLYAAQATAPPKTV